MNTAANEQLGDLPCERVSLADRIARWTTGRNSLETPIPSLNLHRWEMPTEPTSYMLPPGICLIGQGRKRLFLGEETYVYDDMSLSLHDQIAGVTQQLRKQHRPTAKSPNPIRIPLGAETGQ